MSSYNTMSFHIKAHLLSFSFQTCYRDLIYDTLKHKIKKFKDFV